MFWISFSSLPCGLPQDNGDTVHINNIGHSREEHSEHVQKTVSPFSEIADRESHFSFILIVIALIFLFSFLIDT